MAREIVIDPVTRIEGHAKITIQLDDDGQVADARFHVTQFRGFERICQGRPVHELPSIMARICGICPVSHLIASAKACDEILAVEPPPTAVDLRRVLNLAQVVQSHALSFFHLSSPDLLFGFDAEASGRHLFGVLGANPQLARDGVGLRRFGQQVIESIGGKRIHPAGVVPGGMAAPLASETRDQILAGLPEALAATRRALDWYASEVRRFEEEATRFGAFPSAFMGLVGPDGTVEHYDGALRVVGDDGAVLAERADPRPYWEYLGEAVEPWSYPQVGLLEGPRLPRRRLPGRPAGPPQRRRPDGHPAGRRGAGAVPGPARPHPGQLLPLPPGPPHRDPRLPGAAGGAARRPGDPVDPGPLGGRHQPRGGHRRGRGAHGARCCTTTGSTATASSSGPTWSSPPATTTWP